MKYKIHWLAGLALGGLAGLGLPGALTASEWLDAAAGGDVKKIETLFAAEGKRIAETDAKNNTALHMAAKAGKEAVVQALVAHHAVLDAKNTDNETALWLASEANATAAAQALVAAGARVNTMSSHGTTALHRAVAHDNLVLVKLLLEHGAEPDVPTRVVQSRAEPYEAPRIVSETPVQIAASHGRSDVLKLLVEHKAALDNPLATQNGDGNIGGVTLLHLAAQSGNKEMAEFLLPHCQVNATDSDGNTPLHYAARSGSPEVARLLLENKAAVNSKNSHGITPASLAVDLTHHRAEMKALFEKYHGTVDTGFMAVQWLKMLATAQAQYIKKTDTYSVSGKELNQTGTLIPADLAAAFESYQANGDPKQTVSKGGYVFRMLQGDDPDNPRSYYKDPLDPRSGMNTWACTARPLSGEGYQYFISEAGTVYQKKDPGTGKFLLTVTPPQAQTDWDPAK